MSEFSHLDAEGQVRMVDISEKPPVRREAVATGAIRLCPETLARIESHDVAKGNVLATARIAGIQAAKRTSELIPLCHPLSLTHCDLAFEIPPSRDRIAITATTRTTGRTGVEMEALTAVAVAALTVYDMCKAVDPAMTIGDIRLLEKSKRQVA
ncbi:MAG: cyclic pyranopterin monophosphate synthase MoaC [Verrucomicrobiae bacterium]|nr:cyclic pyranopterin monophosphate synthase MoaC [Verrucomicrobiae bacterium]